MSDKHQSRKKSNTDPRALAVTAVQDWYNELITSSCATSEGQDASSTLEYQFAAVQEALEAEYIREHAPDRTSTDEDRAMLSEICAREAGYLIGVQVGLRLRGGVQ